MLERWLIEMTLLWKMFAVFAVLLGHVVAIGIMYGNSIRSLAPRKRSYAAECVDFIVRWVVGLHDEAARFLSSVSGMPDLVAYFALALSEACILVGVIELIIRCRRLERISD